MLRITRIDTDESILLKVEGKLLAAWTRELLAQGASAAAGDGRAVRLDLSQVSFVDSAGLNAVKELTSRSVTIVACSNFVAALLNVEKP